MKKNLNILMTSAMAGLVTCGMLTVNAAQAAEKTPLEKCYGVAKASKNDCQTSSSACAGTAKKDGQKDAWLFLPKGSCEKIVGASLKSGK
ncbi:MAG: DUF2282 domain-containing protein [Gammaproteobacteria bacterium]|nr:DUF2282 domain-containing protein [Gammaproteobacteria bacterium]